MKKLTLPLQTTKPESAPARTYANHPSTSAPPLPVSRPPTLANVLEQLARRPFAGGELKSERQRQIDSVGAVATLIGRDPADIVATADLFSAVELHASIDYPAKQVRRWRIDYMQALRRSELVPILPPAVIKWPQDWQALRDAATERELKAFDHFARYEVLHGRWVADVRNDDLVSYAEDHARLIVWPTARDLANRAIEAFDAVSQRHPEFNLRRLERIPGKRTWQIPSLDSFPDSFAHSYGSYIAFLRTETDLSDPYNYYGLGPIETRTKALAEASILAAQTCLNLLLGAYLWGGGNPQQLAALRDLAGEAAMQHWTAGLSLYANGKPSTHCGSAAHALLLAARFWPEMRADTAMMERLEDAYGLLMPLDRIQTTSTVTAITTFLTKGNIKKTLNAPRCMWRLAPTLAKSSETLVLQQAAVALRILTVAPLWLSDLLALEVGTTLILPSTLGQDGHIILRRGNTEYAHVVPHKLAALLLEYDVTRLKLLAKAGLDPTAERHLFLTSRGRRKNAKIVSAQMTSGLARVASMRLTPTQLRFFGAVVALTRDPKDFETARQLLGHKDSTTTKTRLQLAIRAAGSRKVGTAIAAAADDMVF